MSFRTALGTLGCFIRGHAPIVEIHESENKSELVCERCGKILGDFVLVLSQREAAPDLEMRSNGLPPGDSRGWVSLSKNTNRALETRKPGRARN
jgi:hypothetical protein